MKIKFCIVILLLLSFLNIGAISNNQMTANSFDYLETAFINQSEFSENGVKLQYKTKNNIENEKQRVKEYLIHNIGSNYKENDKNEIECLNDSFNGNIKLWCDEEYTYVEIILINQNPKYKTINLRNILKNIENINLEDVQYFYYYRGKLEKNVDKQFINKLASNIKMKKVNILDISNGCTGTGNLNNGDKVNFALSNYNSGSYIIIGTPIIFVTY